ncbi:MAG: PD40 domain-containing protein, partial [Phycisphaeraceae bacterium]|nr:PD40 domain-containing protein [Phycisphaeraceae bacterium]
LGQTYTDADFGLRLLASPSPTAAPDLLSISDTGKSSTDNLTKLNNASAASTLSFAISGAYPNETVRLYADGVLVGQAVANGSGNATITTDGVTAIVDGQHVFTLRTWIAGLGESADSPALNVTIDTIAPTVIVDTLLTDDTRPVITGTVSEPVSQMELQVPSAYLFAWVMPSNTGTWSVDMSNPSYDTISSLSIGTNDVQVDATDLAGNVGHDLTFGEITVVPASAEIRGVVWNDLNGDNIQNPDESGLAGVTVFIDDNDNKLWDVGEVTRTTDADGVYVFASLHAGTYAIGTVIPDGYQQTYPLDPDANPAIQWISVSYHRYVGNLNANGNSAIPLISDDGRIISFDSDASNLVPDDDNYDMDIFIYDRQTGQMSPLLIGNGFAYDDISLTSISASGAIGYGFSDEAYARPGGWLNKASDGTTGNGPSYNGQISGDGHSAGFFSYSSNLVPGDTNDAIDVFVRDFVTHQTIRVSVASDGTQANGISASGPLNYDGRFVTFISLATNLVPNDTNGVFDVFVYDRQTGQTQRVSVASDGTQANGGSVVSSISADGRFVVFSSAADNLVPNDTNGAKDLFVYDRTTGITQRVNVATDGTQGNANSYKAEISADGRYVAFISGADNLVPGDTNHVADAFVHDLVTGQTRRVSMASDGSQADGDSTYVSISADGRIVVFSSFANNLVPGDEDYSDIFVRDLWQDHVGSQYVTLSVGQIVEQVNFGHSTLSPTPVAPPVPLSSAPLSLPSLSLVPVSDGATEPAMLSSSLQDLLDNANGVKLLLVQDEALVAV